LIVAGLHVVGAWSAQYCSPQAGWSLINEDGQARLMEAWRAWLAWAQIAAAPRRALPAV
jgi:hypothetical protein